MKDETGGVTIEEFVGLKPRRYWFLVDDRNEHRKSKGVNKNMVASISHGEYKDVLLCIKSLRHLMNTVQSKNHQIGMYEINKISFSCFDDEMYILSNGYGGLTDEFIIRKQLS